MGAFAYCSKCEQPIQNWEESYEGCHECGTSDMHIEEAFKYLMDDFRELQNRIKTHVHPITKQVTGNITTRILTEKPL